MFPVSSEPENTAQNFPRNLKGEEDLKVAEFPKLALKHGILLNLPI